MQSQLILVLTHALIKTITDNQLPSFCTLVLQNASSKLYTLKEGLILLQSFSHYLARVELFECQIQREANISLFAIGPCFLMPVFLNGESDLYDHNGKLVSETIGNSCTLIHLTEGSYNWKLQKGNHKLLLITFRPKWFMKTNEIYPEFVQLTENYLSAKYPYHVLPHCALASELFKEFEYSASGIDTVNYSRNSAAYIFIDNCINKYRAHLADGHFDLCTINKMKALAIADYIDLNFAEDVLNNVSSLAEKFNISERSMARYFKKTLNMPWHEYVIKTRMNKAMELLKTSILPVKEIAIKVGYRNQNHFSYSFKKFHGSSPKQAVKRR